MPRIGAHLSAAGGVSRAARAVAALGCDSLQVFLRSPGRWAATTLAKPEVEAFRAAAAPLSGAAFAHAPYLLNLASGDDQLRARSITVLVEELERAGRLGLAGVVLHPGTAGADGVRRGEERCRESLSLALEHASPRAARPLLEVTAGAGGALGVTVRDLARLAPAGAGTSVGVCVDTAHLWSAGHDLLADGWERVTDELAEHWGRGVPDLIHGNDTPVELGARRDRHAAPGAGRLGEAFFRRLLAEPGLAAVPLVVEMPPGEGDRDVAAALDRLRSWSPAP